MGAAVCENKGVGCPGVSLAHVKRVGGVRAEFPGGVQAVKFVVFVDSLGGVGIVVCEALVDVAVVDDGLQFCVTTNFAGCIGRVHSQPLPRAPFCRQRLGLLLLPLLSARGLWLEGPAVKS